jgi:hypothetical protein
MGNFFTNRKNIIYICVGIVVVSILGFVAYRYLNGADNLDNDPANQNVGTKKGKDTSKNSQKGKNESTNIEKDGEKNQNTAGQTSESAENQKPQELKKGLDTQRCIR